MVVHAQIVTDKTLVDPAAVTSGANVSGYIDTLGADYAEVVCAITLGATATIASADGATISVLAGTDTNISNAVTVTANQTAIKRTMSGRFKVDTKTKARYLFAKILAGSAGVSNDNLTAYIGARVSRLEQSPTNTAAMTTGNTNDTVTIVS